jgi:hypothetical protein
MTITITDSAWDCELFEEDRSDYCAQPTMHLVDDEPRCLAHT